MEETKKRTLQEIDREIAATKEALKNVHGSETEVYARIVGYYRAVRNWNKGKADEFKLRKMFTLEDSKVHIKNQENAFYSPDTKNELPAEKNNISTSSLNNASSYEIFTRASCPNCPPVKQYMEAISLPGKSIDVDTQEGLALAATKGVFATPTVIVYDTLGKETARAHSTAELNEIFSSVKNTVFA